MGEYAGDSFDGIARSGWRPVFLYRFVGALDNRVRLLLMDHPISGDDFLPAEAGDQAGG